MTRSIVNGARGVALMICGLCFVGYGGDLLVSSYARVAGSSILGGSEGASFTTHSFGWVASGLMVVVGLIVCLYGARLWRRRRS